MTTFPSLSPVGERRQARLQDARIGVIVGAQRDLDALERHLRAMCEASADLCLLRDDTATEDELRVAAGVFRRVCDDTGALFVCDRLPGLAVQVGADGVHLGAIDVDPDHARHVVGPDVLLGRATRTREEIDRAADEDVDYLVVGHGREPEHQGDLVAYAAKWSSHPWFAVEASLEQARDLVAHGARRVLADGIAAEDPATSVWDRRRLVAAHP